MKKEALPKSSRKPDKKREGKKAILPISIAPHVPDTPLDQLGWVRQPQITALGKLGISTLRGLLEHYPRRHEDRRRFDRFPDTETEVSFCLSGRVGKTVFRREWPRTAV